MHLTRYIMLAVIPLLLLSACSDEEQKTPDLHPRVIVLFSPGGLGDRGYNDLILKGIQTVNKEREELDVLYSSPRSLADAERIFGDWLRLTDVKRPSLFVLASSDYEDMAVSLLGNASGIDRTNKDILLFESNNERGLPLHSFHIQMYGASYLAGTTAAATPASSALVMLGSSNDRPTALAAQGFADGFRDGGKEAVETVALADDWTGFAAADLVYQRMEEWVQRHGFIFPVAGGSNNGVYRYAREYPKGLYTAGMDVDQSALSTQIVGSVVKHIDRLIVDYLNEWLDKGTMPEATVYGLESGYIDWMLSPDYEDALNETVTNSRPAAIAKEKAYEETL